MHTSNDTPMPDLIRRSWRFTLALCVLVLTGIVVTAVQTERSLSRLANTQEVVAHNLMVDQALNALKTQILDAETGLRGFLLSGLAAYLEPYYSALAQMHQSRAALASALSGEPTSAGPLGVLDKAIAIKLEELDRTVELKSVGQADEAVEVILSGVSKKTMSDVREALRVLAWSETNRAEQWGAENAREIQKNYWILATSLALNLLFFIGLVQRLRFAMTQGHTARQVMAARNDELSALLESAAARNKQVHGLSELSRFLQSCVDMDEAVRLLQQQLPSLMKAESGALYLLAEARDELRQAFAWGKGPYAEYFAPGDCWAVRLGQPFHQPRQSGAASCAHLQSGPADAEDDYHCLPLIAHGELLGLLVLDAAIASEQRVNVENEGYRRITLEQVGLSIGNLKLRESLRQQSIRDPLTGLYNRRFLEESAQREVLRATRLETQGRHEGLAVLMIDIDHFKRFNDEHGHEVGDQVLCRVAEVLQQQTRGSDVAARFGGEEFTIVLADMPPALAIERAEHVRVAVEGLALQSSGSDIGAITISLGLAQFPLHGATVESLLLAADKALYVAKRGGRNQVVVAS